MKRRPVEYAWPVVPTSVTALICVAITDRPTAHHGSERFAEKVALDLVRALRSAQAVDHHPRDVDDDDGPVDEAHALGKHPTEKPERNDDRRFEDDDLHEGHHARGAFAVLADVVVLLRCLFGRHNVAARAASARSASSSATFARAHHS